MLLWLHEAGLLGKHALYGYLTFRMVFAAVAGFLLCAGLTWVLIRLLRSMKMFERHNYEDFEHIKPLVEKGLATPAAEKPRTVVSMGGIAITLSVLLSAGFFADLRNPLVLAGLLLMVLCAALGFADDWQKLKHPQSHGMSETSKILIGVLAAAAVLGLLYRMNGVSDDFQTVWLPIFKNTAIHLGGFYFVLFAAVLFVTSNSVNITDGVDGLAAGLVAVASLALAVVCYVVGRTDFSAYLYITHVPGAGELAVLLASCSGAALGFLWHNAAPASIYMGDTGSLPLGAVLGYAGLVSKQEVLMLIVCGIFLIEFASSLIQRVSYKLTGKRYFPIAPVHHTLERAGWPKNHIVVRAYIIGIFLALIALGTLKIR